MLNLTYTLENLVSLWKPRIWKMHPDSPEKPSSAHRVWSPDYNSSKGRNSILLIHFPNIVCTWHIGGFQSCTFIPVHLCVCVCVCVWDWIWPKHPFRSLLGRFLFLQFEIIPPCFPSFPVNRTQQAGAQVHTRINAFCKYGVLVILSGGSDWFGPEGKPACPIREISILTRSTPN
jgi:hypothetical protein